MEVVIVHDYAHVEGGSSQVALQTAAQLALAGYGVTLFAAVGPVADFLTEAGVKVHLLDQPDLLGDSNRIRAAIKGYWNFSAGVSLAEILNDCNPRQTVVHFHYWNKSLTASVAKAAVKRGFSCVVTHHDYSLVCPNGAFYVYPEGRSCQLNPLSLDCLACNCDSRRYLHKIWRYGRTCVQKAMAGLDFGIKQSIVVSDYSRKLIEPHLTKGHKIHLLHNPIRADRLEPASVGTNTSFLYVGRLSREKGVTLLAKATAGLNFTTTIVGDGYLADEMASINPELELKGWLPSSQVQDSIRSARALILPSLWHETQGMSVLEALAQGVPVVVPDACAASEFVSDGQTGAIFRSGDYEDLRNKIKYFEDADYASKLGSQAYSAYWENPYTMQRHLEGLINVYEEALSS